MIFNYKCRHIETILSKRGRNLIARGFSSKVAFPSNPIQEVAKQLEFIPEVSELHALAPSGRRIRAVSDSKHQVNPSISKIANNVSRLLEITRNIGHGGSNDFFLASSRIAASAYESAELVDDGLKLFQSLTKQILNERFPTATERPFFAIYNDYETLLGHIRVGLTAARSEKDFINIGEVYHIAQSNLTRFCDDLVGENTNWIMASLLKLRFSALKPMILMAQGNELSRESTEIHAFLSNYSTDFSAFVSAIESIDLPPETSAYFSGRALFAYSTAVLNSIHILSLACLIRFMKLDQESLQNGILNFEKAEEKLNELESLYNKHPLTTNDLGKSSPLQHLQALYWDSTAMMGQLHSVHSELLVLRGLWNAWSQLASSDESTIAIGSDKTKAMPKGSDTSPVFPFPNKVLPDLNKAIEVAKEKAAAGYQLHSMLDNALAENPTDPSLKAFTREFEINYYTGIERSLFSMALINHVEMKAVSAEGLYRGLLDDIQAHTRSSGAQGLSILSKTHDYEHVWLNLPNIQSAAIGSVLSAYGALLRQWDKREREGEDLATLGRKLLSSASSSHSGLQSYSLQATSPVEDVDPRYIFIRDRTAAFALRAPFIGSWGSTISSDFSAMQ